MTSAIEIGSIIGGRYRVTGLVVSSAEGDDVLSGLDQVLNRSVSILVASKKNASQAAQSGRELATGERRSSIQVLDMVITDGRPALITNTARANDLLDLLVSQDRPFVEPFFTESLGSEIFGQAREETPELDAEWDEHYYDSRDERPLIDLTSMSERARARAAERAAARDAAAAQKAAELKAQQQADQQAQAVRADEAKTRNSRAEGPAAGDARSSGSASVPVRPDSAVAPTAGTAAAGSGSAGAGSGSAGAGSAALGSAAAGVGAAAAGASAASSSTPRSPWGIDEAKTERGQNSAATPAPTSDDSEGPATQAVPAVSESARPAAGTFKRKPSVRPLGPDTDDDASAAHSHQGTGGNQARALAGSVPLAAGAAAGAAEGRGARNADRAPERVVEDDYIDDDDYYEEEEADPKGRTLSRALVGILLGAMLIAAVVLAATQLGSLFKDGAFQAGKSKPTASSSAPEAAASSKPSATGAKPAVASIQRYVPNNATLDSGSDAALGRIIDGNPGSSWGSLVYSNNQFGNLATSFAFVLELKQPTELSELTLQQSYGTGGKFTVLVNDTVSLDGATQVGSGSFSDKTVNVPLKGGSAKKYVIVNVTELPRLSGVKTIYPWGMIINEISVK